jgi:hypothetical protein
MFYHHPVVEHGVSTTILGAGKRKGSNMTVQISITVQFDGDTIESLRTYMLADPDYTCGDPETADEPGPIDVLSNWFVGNMDDGRNHIVAADWKEVP